MSKDTRDSSGANLLVEFAANMFCVLIRMPSRTLTNSQMCGAGSQVSGFFEINYDGHFMVASERPRCYISRKLAASGRKQFQPEGNDF